jgi:transcriptional regulator with XRE-family HTH domain
MSTIRTLRQERGWTQFELALKVGVQPQAVYLWESGRRTRRRPRCRRHARPAARRPLPRRAGAGSRPERPRGGAD